MATVDCDVNRDYMYYKQNKKRVKLDDAHRPVDLCATLLMILLLVAPFNSKDIGNVAKRRWFISINVLLIVILFLYVWDYILNHRCYFFFYVHASHRHCCIRQMYIVTTTLCCFSLDRNTILLFPPSSESKYIICGQRNSVPSQCRHSSTLLIHRRTLFWYTYIYVCFLHKLFSFSMLFLVFNFLYIFFIVLIVY